MMCKSRVSALIQDLRHCSKEKGSNVVANE